MVTTVTIYIVLISIQTNGLKSVVTVCGLKVATAHQQQFQDKECIYLVVTMAQDN